MHPTVLSWLAEERVRELHAAADQWRLAAAARASRKRPASRSASAGSVWRRLARAAGSPALGVAARLRRNRLGTVRGYCASC